MSEQFILDNDSFEQDLNEGLNPDSFERRGGAIRNSRRKKPKSIAAAKRAAKKASARARRARKKVGIVSRRFR